MSQPIRRHHPQRMRTQSRRRGSMQACNPPMEVASMLAADYPFLDVFWTMILFFFWVAWIWVVVLIFAPFLGVLIYMIANGRGMAERSAARAQENREMFAQYATPAASN